MTTYVTLDVFSGRDNPVWALEADEENKLKKLLKEQKGRQVSLKAPGIARGLGYRGFIISEDPANARNEHGTRIYGGLTDPGVHTMSLLSENTNAEEFLLECAKPVLEQKKLDLPLRELIRPIRRDLLDLSDFVIERLIDDAEEGCPTCLASDAPTFDTTLWNSARTQPFNNCYNYANNRITNTFAQPGRASGQMAASMACNEVTPAAERDGLVQHANFSDQLRPNGGYYVALVVWPGMDYHWYRQDQNGCWSHKPGQTAARNTDNSGDAISDPQSCDRGNYTEFCGYMITKCRVPIE